MKQFLVLFFLLLSESLSAQGKFFGGNGDGFATITLTNIALPVNILNFSVYNRGQANKADLFLQYNGGICSLRLQRSIDGHSFSDIDSLQHTGSGGTSKQFTFTDAAPATGINYYRVCINRCNASFLYTTIVSVKTGRMNNQLYYSAADNTIHYTIAENGLLKLGNGSGQIIFNKMLIAGSGVLLLPTLSNAIYFLQFDQEAPIKIVVQK